MCNAAEFRVATATWASYGYINLKRISANSVKKTSGLSTSTKVSSTGYTLTQRTEVQLRPTNTTANTFDEVNAYRGWKNSAQKFPTQSKVGLLVGRLERKAGHTKVTVPVDLNDFSQNSKFIAQNPIFELRTCSLKRKSRDRQKCFLHFLYLTKLGNKIAASILKCYLKHQYKVEVCPFFSQCKPTQIKPLSKRAQRTVCLY